MWIINVILSVLLWLIAIIAFLLLIVLLVPFKYSILGQKQSDYSFRASIRWLSGAIRLEYNLHSGKIRQLLLIILGIRITLPDTSAKASDGNKDDEACDMAELLDNGQEDANGADGRKKAGKNKAGDKFSDSLRFLRYISLALFQEAAMALVRMIKDIAPQKLHIAGKIGLEDPCDTATLNMILMAVGSLNKNYRIRIQPVFDEEVLEGSVFAAGSLWFIQMVIILFRLLISKPVRKIIGSEIRYWFNNKVKHKFKTKSKNRGGIGYVQ